MKPVTLVLVGAGNRGSLYASLARRVSVPAQVVAVAEPHQRRRIAIAEEHQIPRENVCHDWKQLAQRSKFAGAVVITTPDAMHTQPAIAFAELGYHMLLEKPIAHQEPECKEIVRVIQNNGVLFAVAHVLRYATYTRRIKKLIAAGTIGDIVNIQHLEPVGYWRQAHAFVRGNWSRASGSCFMLLAKSCHDIDWIHHIMDVKCLAVSSFGSLHHFRSDKVPDGAAHRCVECRLEAQCPYSALKIYQRERIRLHDLDLLDEDEPAIMKALAEGPYGRCVYHCDNDVVDNQVVNMQFDGGRTASFTMTAFTAPGARRTRIFGTHGSLEVDGTCVRHHDFRTDETTTIDMAPATTTVYDGHGGGDAGLVESFLGAVATGDPKQVLSGPEESLETHLTTFAAERSRLEGRVVNLQ